MSRLHPLSARAARGRRHETATVISLVVPPKSARQVNWVVQSQANQHFLQDSRHHVAAAPSSTDCETRVFLSADVASRCTRFPLLGG